MIVIAKTSFVCLDFSMVEGDVREIADITAKDLLKAGYVEEKKSAPKGKKGTPKGE